MSFVFWKRYRIISVLKWWKLTYIQLCLLHTKLIQTYKVTQERSSFMRYFRTFKVYSILFIKYSKYREQEQRFALYIVHILFEYVQAGLFQFHISPDIANLTDGNIICISLEFRALSHLSRHVTPCICTRICAQRVCDTNGNHDTVVRKLRGLGASL